ncbi:ogr/Delta-like zinc finger family protein [Marinobacter sp. 1-3A]|uniref:ogr/Delta-like zinc finger family protein n=1 Tax=Marinobacter sp. 1-3A TaxID=2582920 RepID=UPI0019054953|nr:ogr/Delta-like zinc finger family protein [Marinobacter sp. 1-3A]MBK1874608.1 ogr/Delta-like zinc finger family protein [Marinobacter sp. 1-3A]
MKLNQITRNYLTIGCPACGESCSIQSSRSIQQRGKDAFVQCRNIECGYRGSVELSYGPVLQAMNPKAPDPDSQQKLQAGVRNSFLKILCPHCVGVCRVRTSVQMISAQRQLYVFCQDTEHCGYKGVVFLTHTDRLSLDPEGNVREIPLAPEVREQCQQEMQLAHERFSLKKKDTVK